jgi:RNA polymerase sigma-32 factor
MRDPARLSRDEEQALARRFRDHGDIAARDRLVLAHLPLGRALANRAKAGGVPREDLEQQAVLGLIRSVESFDPERGLRFNTFARWWVRAFLDRYILRNARLVRPSLGKGRGKRLAGIRVVSLDQPIGGDEEGLRLADVFADEAPLPDELAAVSIDGEVRASRIDVALASLDARSRAVVEGRFLEGARLRVIGERLGLSKERVRQIESAALKRLRELITAAK